MLNMIQLLSAFVLLACSIPSAAQRSCRGSCGEEYYRGHACSCDYECLVHDECCKDYEAQCTTRDSCTGRCGEKFKRGRQCSCDADCQRYKQCCPDYTSSCDAEETAKGPAGPTSAATSSCNNVNNNKPTEYQPPVAPPKKVNPVTTTETAKGPVCTTPPPTTSSCNNVNNIKPTDLTDDQLIPFITPEPELPDYYDDMSVDTYPNIPNDPNIPADPEQDDPIVIATSIPENTGGNQPTDLPTPVPSDPSPAQTTPKTDSEDDPEAIAEETYTALPENQDDPSLYLHPTGPTEVLPPQDQDESTSPPEVLPPQADGKPSPTASADEAPHAEEPDSSGPSGQPDSSQKPPVSDTTPSGSPTSQPAPPGASQPPGQASPSSEPQPGPGPTQINPDVLPEEQDETQPEASNDGASPTKVSPSNSEETDIPATTPASTGPTQGSSENSNSSAAPDSTSLAPDNLLPEEQGDSQPETQNVGDSPTTGSEGLSSNPEKTDTLATTPASAGSTSPPPNNLLPEEQDDAQPEPQNGGESPTEGSPPSTEKTDILATTPDSTPAFSPASTPASTGPTKGSSDSGPLVSDPDSISPQPNPTSPVSSDNQPGVQDESLTTLPTAGRENEEGDDTAPEKTTADPMKSTPASNTPAPAKPTTPKTPPKKPEPKPTINISKPKPKPTKPGVLTDIAQGLATDNPRDYQADGNNDTDLCSGRPASAVTTLRNGTLVVFRGHYFWMLDSNRNPGPARGITDVWGVPSPIDTVFTRCNCNGKTYILKGLQYWRFENGMVDPGYPKLISTGFDGLQGQITAALSVPEYRRRRESVYFFKRGGLVQRYSYKQGTSPSCGRKVVYTVRRRTARQAESPLGATINIRVSWKGFPSTVTSAVSVPNRRLREGYSYYVFSRSKYYNVKMENERPALATPLNAPAQQNSAKNFFNCPKEV